VYNGDANISGPPTQTNISQQQSDSHRVHHVTCDGGDKTPALMLLTSLTLTTSTNRLTVPTYTDI